MWQPSLKIRTSISATFDFRLCTTDVSQAYLQFWMPLLQNVYIRTTRAFSLPPGTFLRLLRPSYGLRDAGDYWHATFARCMKEELHMLQKFGDLALFLKHEPGQLMGLAGTYVDDYL